MDSEKEPPNPDNLTDAQIEPPVKKEIGFDKILIVDNIPKVTKDKVEKLEKVLQKLWSALGTVKRMYLAKTDAGETKGYMFIEFETVEGAEIALKKLNGHVLDVNHTFKVTRFKDFDEVMKAPETFTPKQPEKFEQKGNLRGWLLDPRGIDQYVLLAGSVTEVCWNDLKSDKPVIDISRDNWTEVFVKWSPLGSYLTTIHQKGIQIWGTPTWESCGRFHHEGVKLLQYSPNERYLVTASTGEEGVIMVWEIRTRRKIREIANIETQHQWPIFKWSHDDKYVARITPGKSISVYEAATMELLEKSIKIDSVRDFAWSPTENLIAYSVIPPAENKSQDKPANITIIEIPSKKEKTSKNMFMVTDLKLYWQSNGDYLTVVATKEVKKKVSYSSLTFRMREKSIPSEILDIEIENFINLFWEPKGTRFALIHGETTLRPNVSFYSVDGSNTKFLNTLEKKPVSALFWSPQGNYVVLAGLQSQSGILEFFDVNAMETLAIEEHFTCTSVEWDPTGRYVLTAVSFWRYQIENGYNIYSFSGKLLKKMLREKLYEIYWRPRPPSLLPPEKIKEIEKNYKFYAKKYKKEDEIQIDRARALREKKRKDLTQAFQLLMKELDDDYKSHREERHSLFPDYKSDDEWANDFEEAEVWVDQDLGEEVTLIG